MGSEIYFSIGWVYARGAKELKPYGNNIFNKSSQREVILNSFHSRYPLGEFS